jgi:geranylgeranyl reductase family protein
VKRVAVLGGGPSGAFAAERLAAAGLETVILDEKLAWEKPCGGGITYKAYQKYPFLRENSTPKRVVTESVIGAPKSGTAELSMSRPLLIYSRYDLNRMLLERAERAGARIEQARVTAIEQRDKGWRVQTRHGAIDADYCVVATGARNPLRQVGTSWTAEDTMIALGYYVPSSQEHIDIQFLAQLEGYIWVFPRCGHLSVGICGKGEPAQVLRARLDRYMQEKGISLSGAQFYAHMLPALSSGSWKGNRIAGERWMAVGDAGGLVDPVTGEGLYYAIRSGDLASQTILDDAHPVEAKARAYRRLIQHDFAEDLYLGSLLARRIFLGKFLFGAIPSRMVEFMRSSARFRGVMEDLFAGTQGYRDLRTQLLRSFNGTMREVTMSFLLRRMLPEPNRP